MLCRLQKSSMSSIILKFGMFIAIELLTNNVDIEMEAWVWAERWMAEFEETSRQTNRRNTCSCQIAEDQSLIARVQTRTVYGQSRALTISCVAEEVT